MEKFFYFMHNSIIPDILMIVSFFYTPIALVAVLAMEMLRSFGLYDAQNVETYILYSAVAGIMLFTISYALIECEAERYDKEYDQLHSLYDSMGQRIERA